jgi:NAD(P)-dependent dehydrogenase (short-subunit alcohol dehydrogenase family)
MYTSNAKKKILNKLSFKNFNNKTFVLTGYSSGIGENLFKYLNALGSKLILIGKKKINHHLFYNCDLSQNEELEKVVKKISKENNKIDGFVHCAAINEIFKINKVTLKNWNKVLSVNLTSAFIISKHLKKNLSKAKHSSIVFVSSIAGHRKSLVSGVHYVSSKAGLIGLSKQLSHEFGRHNIRVNCVSPSQTITKMLSESMTKKEIKSLVGSIPLKRLASVDDQASSILFLLSPLSNYITGITLNVDGGQI